MSRVVGEIVAIIVTLSLTFHFCIIALQVGLLVVGGGSASGAGRSDIFRTMAPSLFKNLGIAMAIFAFASSSPDVAVVAIMCMGVGLVMSRGQEVVLPRIERATLYSAIISLGALNVFYLAVR